MARPYQGWSVFFRSDKGPRGRWILSRDGKQKLIPLEVKNKKEAVKWATAWLTEQGFLEDDGTAKRQDETNTVGELADKWIKWRIEHIGKGWESATVSNNRSHVKKRIKPGLGKLAVTECTPRAIASWLNTLTDAPNTIRNLYRSVVAMFDDAIEQEWVKLEFNPARATLVSKAVPEAMTKAQEVQADTELTIEQCRIITSDPRIRFERRVKYLLTTTAVLRDGELQGISWGAVNFELGTIRIVQSAKIRRFKDDADVGKPKTRRGRRVIPIHSAALAALRDWRANWIAKHGEEPSSEMPVFPGRSHYEFTRIKAAQKFRDDLCRVGIPETVDGVNLVFHHLRHTGLNLLRRAKVEPLIRDYLAGHAPSSVGDGSYQHGTVDDLRAAVELIPLVWAGVDGSFSARLCAAVTETQIDEAE
jgi:integrase